jgi:hypothetical protein
VTPAPAWFALLDGSAEDVVQVKQHFTASGFAFDEIDGKFALSAPSLETCAEGDYDSVIDLATELVDAMNVALRISSRHFVGFELQGIAERRDGRMHRVMMARGGSYSISGAAAVGVAGWFVKPVRSKQERLASLIAADDRISDIAHGLAIRPVTWPALAKAYETIVGVMSTNADPQKARADYENLIAKGWLSGDESSSFYHTAAYHRHGYPKAPMRTSNPMSYETACALLDRLLWRVVDELQPT